MSTFHKPITDAITISFQSNQIMSYGRNSVGRFVMYGILVKRRILIEKG